MFHNGRYNWDTKQLGLGNKVFKVSQFKVKSTNFVTTDSSTNSQQVASFHLAKQSLIQKEMISTTYWLFYLQIVLHLKQLCTGLELRTAFQQLHFIVHPFAMTTGPHLQGIILFAS